MSREKKTFAPETATISNSIYHQSVIKRAMERGGHCPNLKGHVNEILTVDKMNRNPNNLFSGKYACLTKSTTAIRDDVIEKQAGKVVGRYQLKDTPKGIADTVKKVEQHQYKGTNLMGTKETAKAYDTAVQKANLKGKNITQKMTSNGISSSETELISAKALGGSVVKNAKNIAKSSHKVGVMGAVLGGGIETVKSTAAVHKGEKSMQEAAGDVAKESAISYVAGAAGGATDAAVTIGLAATPAAPVSKPAGTVCGVFVSGAVYKGLHKVFGKK